MIGPLEQPDAVGRNYHVWAAVQADLPGATSSAKQPGALGRALVVVERCRVGLHGGAAERGVRGERDARSRRLWAG